MKGMNDDSLIQENVALKDKVKALMLEVEKFDELKKSAESNEQVIITAKEKVA
jgi:hypothetical protein